METQVVSIGDYRFEVQANPANPGGYMQRDVFYAIEGQDSRFLRSFYFDDISPEIIESFCRHFTDDSDYRDASIARRTDWAQCNDLFLRNCFNPYFQNNPFLEQIGSLVRAYQFFKEHTPAILASPDYQRINQLDSAIVPDAHQPDPHIAEHITLFNQIEGVKTLASCQGVSGTVSYQNHDIMTLSPHARYAYIWFADIPPELITERCQTPFLSVIYRDDVYPELQSTGDNPAFLAEIHVWLNKLG